MQWRTLIQYWTEIDRLVIDRLIKTDYNTITLKQTEVAMSNNITIKLSDKAIVQIIKILSASSTPTGMPIHPFAMLGALGGMPPRPKLEEVEEDKPTIGFKASK